MMEQVKNVEQQMSKDCFILKENIRDLLDLLSKINYEQFQYLENNDFYLSLKAVDKSSLKEIALKIQDQNHAVEWSQHPSQQQAKPLKFQSVAQYLIEEYELSEYFFESKIFSYEEVTYIYIYQNFFDAQTIKSLIKTQQSFLISKDAKEIGEKISLIPLLSDLQLDLQQNMIKGIGAVGLGQGISACKNMKNLHIDLSLAQGDFSGLMEGINKCENLSELKLILNQNNLDSNNIYKFGVQLGKCLKLNELFLQMNHQKLIEISCQGLGIGISQLQDLQKLLLNLQYCDIYEEGVNEIGKAIQNCSKLENIIINLKQIIIDLINKYKKLVNFINSGNRIKQVGAEQVAKGIGNNKNLKEIDVQLMTNLIQTKGGIFLGQGISNCTNSTSLNLFLVSNSIGPQGITAISQGLSLCKQLKKLKINIYQNSIASEGLVSLGIAISQLQSLEILLLSSHYCKIDKVGGIEFGKSLMKCTNLKILDMNIQHNELMSEGVEGLGKGLSQCTQLEKLVLDITQFQQRCLSGCFYEFYLKQLNQNYFIKCNIFT
ncbi:hypothetical protein ABPG72_022559 [Tetrahymena utriculariae]